MAKRYKYANVLAEMKRNYETLKDLSQILGICILTLRKKLAGETEWTIGEIETLCKHYNKDYYELFK